MQNRKLTKTEDSSSPQLIPVLGRVFPCTRSRVHSKPRNKPSFFCESGTAEPLFSMKLRVQLNPIHLQNHKKVYPARVAGYNPEPTFSSAPFLRHMVMCYHCNALVIRYSNLFQNILKTLFPTLRTILCHIMYKNYLYLQLFCVLFIQFSQIFHQLI